MMKVFYRNLWCIAIVLVAIAATYMIWGKFWVMR
jgi:hypothetical protein